MSSTWNSFLMESPLFCQHGKRPISNFQRNTIKRGKENGEVLLINHQTIVSNIELIWCFRTIKCQER